MSTIIETPEFSRVILLDKVGQAPLTSRVQAVPGECEALSKRLDIVSIGRLEADFTIRKGEYANSFEVDGHVSADVVQSCVVTWVDVPATLNFPIRLIFRQYSPDSVHTVDSDQELVGDDVDIDDLAGQETIDIGEITAQYLSLALDPYPRAAGVAAPEVVAETAKVVPLSPFEKLKDLKK